MKKFGNQDVKELLEKFGSPLYLYQEKILRENCQKIKQLAVLDNFAIHYAIKANTNIALLKIIQQEGLQAEVISPFEAMQVELAGFDKKQIFYSSNNITESAMQWIIQKGYFLCIDALCQLERYWKLGGKKPVCLRLNPTTGAGHHDRVITAGKVKFGVDIAQLKEAFLLAKKYHGNIGGFNVHIGSLFLEPSLYHQAVEELLAITEQYPSIDYLDFGGGFGIAYRETEQDFPIASYAKIFQETLLKWTKKEKRKITFGIQPGRYIVGNTGVCLTQVQSIKRNRGIDFVGVDLGFNFLLRPEFYKAYHKIEHSSDKGSEQKKFTIVGNICESGDVLGKDRFLPKNTEVGDILIIKDTGAYGFSMASNYNSMPRPAEILITMDGTAKLIRKKEEFSDITRQQIF